MRRSLCGTKFSNGRPRGRDDDHKRASGDRDGSDKERGDGDHGYDPRRRVGALKPEEQKERVKQKNKNNVKIFEK